MSERQTIEKSDEAGKSPAVAVVTSMDETSVGNLPSDWKAKRLEEITGESLYGAAESAEEFDTEKPRYVRVTDLYEGRNGLKDKEKKSLSRDVAGEKYLLEPGDFLFARSGSVGKTYYYDGSDGACAYGGYLIKFPVDKSQINPVFLQQYTHSSLYWNWVKRITRTGAQPNINAREYSSLLIPVPPSPEQRKIASVLHTVDQASQKTEEIIEQTRRAKQGVAQELFHNGIGQENTIDSWLGEIPTSWDIVPFSEIIESHRNGLYKSEEAYGQGYPIAKMGNALEKLKLDMSSFERLELTEKEKEKYKLQQGDLIFARRAQEVSAAGDCTLVPELDELTVFESSLIRVRLKYSALPMFYMQYFKGPVGRRSIKRIVTETSISGVAASDLLDLQVPVPRKEEQEKIAATLSSFDDQVKALNDELVQLELLKTGLMQDLLTGEVRTKNRNIEVVDAVREVEE